MRQSVARLTSSMRRRLFGGSSSYWQERYAAGGTSGAGSYGILADFKARVLNEFVRANCVQSVLEFGCGDGNQLALAEYPTYVGLDVAPAAIDRCTDAFAADVSKTFLLYSPRQFHDPLRILHAELGLSLDVVYHLVEDEIFGKYMTDLFAAADRFVIVYASNRTINDAAPHVRHRAFTDWVEVHRPDWTLERVIENPHRNLIEGAVADFYCFVRR